MDASIDLSGIDDADFGPLLQDTNSSDLLVTMEGLDLTLSWEQGRRLWDALRSWYDPTRDAMAFKAVGLVKGLGKLPPPWVAIYGKPGVKHLPPREGLYLVHAMTTDHDAPLLTTVEYDVDRGGWLTIRECRDAITHWIDVRELAGLPVLILEGSPPG